MKPLEKIDLMTTKENVGRIQMYLKMGLFSGVAVTTSSDVVQFTYLHLPNLSPIHEIAKDVSYTVEKFAA